MGKLMISSNNALMDEMSNIKTRGLRMRLSNLLKDLLLVFCVLIEPRLAVQSRVDAATLRQWKEESQGPFFPEERCHLIVLEPVCDACRAKYDL